MSDKTRVTVALSVFNEEDDLRDILECILAQDFGDFDLQIVDNASTDSSIEICREFAARDTRITVWQNTHNVGPIQNFHRCMWRGSADYVQLHSANDRSRPWELGRLVATLDEHPDTCLAYATHTTPKPPYPNLTEEEPFDRIDHLIADFQSGHMLYGLFRRSTIDLCSPVPYRMCADQIFLAEAALYGKIRAVDTLSYDRKDHARQTPHVAELCSDYWPRQIDEPTPIEVETGVLTPYLEGFVGYLEMIDRARIASAQKPVLKERVTKAYIERWGRHLIREAEEFFGRAVRFLQDDIECSVARHSHGTRVLEGLIRLQLLIPPDEEHQDLIQKVTSKLVIPRNASS